MRDARPSGVSQRHLPDAAAWQLLSESLANRPNSPIREVIERGVGSAEALLTEVRSRDHTNQPRHPFPGGPKVDPMWVRMLANPGQAAIAGIDVILVAVDVHVRQVTDNLRVSQTHGLPLEKARPEIEAGWRDAVSSTEIGGPPGIAGTCAALDPALWFFGKWSCAFCEAHAARATIGRACSACTLAV